MRITPFKQGLLDGWRRKCDQITTYTGRRKGDYRRGVVIGCTREVIRAMNRLYAEMDLLRAEVEAQTRDQMHLAVGS